ncbi:Uncharacterised protein [Shigella sonnei]|uniref:Uncharacterized protein n=2 Tax=Shigella sonnei TaxID=624 RepID=A0ABC9KPZ6_SHISO|nr:Uncharacterised protein [Shigella sonnei]CST28764.1 Uncharacterised protein [Shigella sonnei]
MGWQKCSGIKRSYLVKLKVPGSTIKNRSPFFTCLKYVQQPILMATSSPR